MLKFLAGLGLILPIQPALAWDAAGHRAICMKAWQEMSPAARASASELLDVAGPDAFAETCTWADEIVLQRSATAAWHFIHIPKGARDVDIARDCGPDKNCLVAQIERHRAIVAGTGSKHTRAEGLKFLAHLVGDVHQPLHVGLAEDRGGADIKITFMSRAMSLHELWDSALLATPDPPSRGYTPFLQEMTDRYNRERWSSGAAQDWAEESMWIMRAPPTGYVGNPGGLAFDEIYVRQNYFVAADQIGKAGVRLGMMLNEIFK